MTIATHQRLHLFGTIINSEMAMSPLGHIVESCWQEIPQHYASVTLDLYIIMPNHMHGIILLDGETSKTSLSQIINTFKGAVTRMARKKTLAIDLEYPVWQRSSHDHIIRNQQDYDMIAQYVVNNPAKWDEDSLNA